MKVSGNIETILNYFVANIQEVQKNDYKTTETIALLIDLAHNSLETLHQLGEKDEKLQRYIKALIFQSLAHSELDELCVEEGDSHD